MSLLSVRDLQLHFPIRSGLLLRQTGLVKAVHGVSLDVQRGETVGLVGESGCGKSTLGRTVIRLYEKTAGSVRFGNQEVSELKGRDLHGFRRDVQMIFQDPYSSLNPRKTVSSILEAPLVVHTTMSADERRKHVEGLLEKVGLHRHALNRYPHEFSGGQRQRIAIARAIALKPKLVIADEPVSALDVSVQSQILNLMRDLQDEMGMAYLFISHNLAVVKHMADRIAVMYLGKIVELAPKEELFANPQHPYTKALIAANPIPGRGKKHHQRVLEGEVPSPINPPSGCAFHPRCPLRMPRCSEDTPILTTDAGGQRSVACFAVGGATHSSQGASAGSSDHSKGKSPRS